MGLIGLFKLMNLQPKTDGRRTISRRQPAGITASVAVHLLLLHHSLSGDQGGAQKVRIKAGTVMMSQPAWHVQGGNGYNLGEAGMLKKGGQRCSCN